MPEMNDDDLRRLLDDVRSRAVPPDDAVAMLRRLPFSDLGFARVDHHRELRQGIAEAVYGPGKTPTQCAAIVAELLAVGTGPVLLTRARPSQVAAATARCPGGEVTPTVRAGGEPGEQLELSMVVWRPAPRRDGHVVVITAGTADLPVAMECDATLRAYGIAPTLLADCGVAGLHRLLSVRHELAKADAVVVVAGMEGALASVVGGLTGAPVVAVPTSVGYGASLAGVTALLAMLSSCAAGLTVVGIDNGFGAANAVVRILS
jgi:NCAIR mutase (PurE)-related protein